MIDFEKSDACQNVGDTVIAVPPKSDGRGQQRQLYRIGAFPFRPHPGKIEQEQDRNRDGNGNDDLLPIVEERRRNEWSATGVIRFECISHALRRKKHRCGKPGGTRRKVEPARQRSEGTRLRVVDAAKTVGLHHPVPDAPEEDNQNDSLEVPPVKSDAN